MCARSLQTMAEPRKPARDVCSHAVHACTHARRPGSSRAESPHLVVDAEVLFIFVPQRNEAFVPAAASESSERSRHSARLLGREGMKGGVL